VLLAAADALCRSLWGSARRAGGCGAFDAAHASLRAARDGWEGVLLRCEARDEFSSRFNVASSTLQELQGDIVAVIEAASMSGAAGFSLPPRVAALAATREARRAATEAHEARMRPMLAELRRLA